MTWRNDMTSLTTPRGHGETLFRPGVDEMSAEVAANRTLFERCEAVILGCSLRHWRGKARRELAVLANRYSRWLDDVGAIGDWGLRESRSESPRQEVWHGTGCYNDARYGVSRYGSAMHRPNGPHRLAEEHSSGGRWPGCSDVRGDGQHGSECIGGESWPGEVPLIVTGHQCQFFHCGILIKYLLLDRLAELTGGVALNLAVDCDSPKHTAFEVPVREEGRLTLKRLRLVQGDGELPVEFQPVPSEEQLESMLAEIAKWDSAGDLAGRIEELVIVFRDCMRRSHSLAQFFSLLNRACAGRLGLAWREVPVSAIAGTGVFGAFLGDMMGRAQEMHACYNEALADYRRAHRLRGVLQPLPDLLGPDKADGAWELPFWVVRRNQRRMTLFVRYERVRAVLSDGQNDVLAVRRDSLEDASRACEAMPGALRDLGVSLRPKAVALTAFARLFVADYFIHGIGGARYDQVTDSFIRSFYDVTPPLFACASATMRLSLGRQPSPAEVTAKLRQLGQRERHLRYNPQLYVKATGEMAELCEQRRAAIDQSNHLRMTGGLPEKRREVFETIRKLNSRLVAGAGSAAENLARERKLTVAQQGQSGIAHGREYYFGLFEAGEIDLLRGDKPAMKRSIREVSQRSRANGMADVESGAPNSVES